MSNVAKLQKAARVEDYLGPAEVIDVAGADVEVELPDGASARARLALAFPYEPAPGDVLLIIGRGDAYYVIGVLQGSGRSTLSFQGNVDLNAVGGELRLSGDKGVRVSGPEVEIFAGKLRLVADDAVEKFRSFYQRVSELLSVRARQTHTIVDESSFARSKSGTILTEETMSINGKQIHLG